MEATSNIETGPRWARRGVHTTGEEERAFPFWGPPLGGPALQLSKHLIPQPSGAGGKEQDGGDRARAPQSV